jgi:hypothetical protein
MKYADDPADNAGWCSSWYSRQFSGPSWSINKKLEKLIYQVFQQISI